MIHDYSDAYFLHRSVDRRAPYRAVRADNRTVQHVSYYTVGLEWTEETRYSACVRWSPFGGSLVRGVVRVAGVAVGVYGNDAMLRAVAQLDASRCIIVLVNADRVFRGLGCFWD